MNVRDAKQDSSELNYISKKVMINGQFVTLYSANGQTWISSPEDLPALMDRLENARVTLNTAEKVSEGETAKVAAPEGQIKKTNAEVPERTLSTKYRMKGPKPRPILRQDGVVVKGTPVEPISASSAVMSFSSDVKQPEDKKAVTRSPKGAKSGKGKEVKLIAPIPVTPPTKAQARAAAAANKAAVKAALKATGKAAAKTAINAKVKAAKVISVASKKSETPKQSGKRAVKKGTALNKASTSQGSNSTTSSVRAVSKKGSGAAKPMSKKGKASPKSRSHAKAAKRK